MTSILNDIAFYNEKITASEINIKKTYLNLLNEYFLNILEKKKIKNNGYFKFIFNRGIKTINHVFIFLLIYIKNLPIIANESKKGYFYYIEFIEQIMDEDYNFLHLSSCEATLFVYKKTIYDINQNFRKNNFLLNNQDNDLVESLNNQFLIYNNKYILLLEKCLENKYDKEKIELELENLSDLLK